MTAINERDPWQHRAEGLRCATCMWWTQKLDEVGRCRRHAPSMTGYPVVYATDWCGDHKLDEVVAQQRHKAMVSATDRAVRSMIGETQ